MSRLLVSALAVLVASTGCADSKTINGKLCEPYGIFSEEAKCSGVKYQVYPESVIWAVAGCGGIVIPVYMVGWALWEPIGPDEDAP